MNDTLTVIDETAASMADLLDYAPPVPEAPVLVEDPDLQMIDAEALTIIKHIRRVFTERASIAADAKKMRAQEVADARDYLANNDRLLRLKAWVARRLWGRRRSITTLAGSVGFETVPARCIVEDAGLALPWLKKYHPEAVEERIVADKLPRPTSSYSETGEIVWTAPGPGLKAEPERDELTINGRRIDVLLRSDKDAGKDGRDE